MTTSHPRPASWPLLRALAEIRALQSNRHHRETTNTFFVEGVRDFVQAVDHNWPIELVFYSERLLTAPLARKFVRRLRRARTPTLRVSPEEFRSVSRRERASGIGAILRQQWLPLPEARPGQGLCWVVIGQVRSPGNLGTIIRSSDAVGGAGFILLDRSVDPYGPDVIRASMGAVFRQHFIRTCRRGLMDWAETNRAQIVGASPDGTRDFQEFIYPESPLLFLGEERRGLTDEQRGMCDHLVRIPMKGEGDSLNLGVAGSLLMYEVGRGRWG